MRRPGASREPGFTTVRLGSACQAPPSVAVQRPCLTEFCGSEPAPSTDVPSALQRPGRFPRAGPYGDLRHDPHCHGAFCVHEPMSGASRTDLPSATQRPCLTETYDIHRTPMARFACMSLCPARRAPTYQAQRESPALRRLSAYPARPRSALRALACARRVRHRHLSQRKGRGAYQ